jgi:peptide/nickel transport system permease protein
MLKIKPKKEGFTREFLLTLTLLRKNPLAVAGLAIVLCMVLIAAFASFLAPYDPLTINLIRRLQPPTLGHPMGTDELGRDLFSRVIFGARVSLGIGIVVMGIAASVGTIIGLISGYFGKFVDNLVMRIMDVILAFPPFVLAIAIAAAMGPSLINAMLAVAFVQIPKFARLVRGETLSVKENDFVSSARLVGADSLRIMFRHILPNCVHSVIILATLVVGESIIYTASLSFIGLGAQPPTPEWGAIVSVGRKYLMDQWWYPTFPGLMILIVVMGFNLLGDALRDVLDPRIRR